MSHAHINQILVDMLGNQNTRSVKALPNKAATELYFALNKIVHLDQIHVFSHIILWHFPIHIWDDVHCIKMIESGIQYEWG